LGKKGELEMNELRDRAALALDNTHAPKLAYRGPKTLRMREYLAGWLDGVERSEPKALAAIRWLEHIAK
jgi:hypothetical protein